MVQTSTAPPSSVRLLRSAALVCLLEGAVLVAMGVVEIASLHPSKPLVGVTTTTFFLVYAAALALAARALAKVHSWARAPLLLAQLIQLGLAWSFLGTGTDWVAALLAIPALFVAIVLLLPSTTAALYGGSGPDDVPAG